MKTKYKLTKAQIINRWQLRSEIAKRMNPTRFRCTYRIHDAGLDNPFASHLALKVLYNASNRLQ